jgi:SseB protein N-terminal domain
MSTATTYVDLGAALATWHADAIDAGQLQAAFDAGTVYVQRTTTEDGRPAVVAVGQPGAGYVAFFSSLESLAAHAGECDWASAPGRDLVDLVPEGYGLVVDPAGPHAAVMPARAMRRAVVISKELRS